MIYNHSLGWILYMIIALSSGVLHAVTLRGKRFLLRKFCLLLTTWGDGQYSEIANISTDKWIPRNLLPFSESAPSISSNNRRYFIIQLV